MISKCMNVHFTGPICDRNDDLHAEHHYKSCNGDDFYWSHEDSGILILPAKEEIMFVLCPEDVIAA